MPDFNSTVPAGFRQIPGFPRYAIDENGTVISICPRNGKGKDRPWADAKRLRSVPNKTGYYTVHLSVDAIQDKRRYVHVLVLTTFVGPCPDGMQCRHLDGNRANNHKDNLAWGTITENHQDKILHGTVGTKLKADDVLEIRRRYASGEKQKDIAKDFGVDQVNISHIVLRKSWKHI